MSTKIYNGFKIDTDNIFEVQKILMEHHTEVKEITENKTIEFLITSAVENFDKDTINNKDTTKNYLSDVGSDLLDRQREIRKSGERDPAVDFEAEIVVIPYEGKFYGIYYTEKDDFLQALLKHPKVSEFGYWNNTDKPDGVSAKEWKQREKIWDGMFKECSIPCEIGFSKKFNSYVPYPKIEKVIQKWDMFCPTFESRLKLCTSETYISREMERQKDKIDKDDYHTALSLYLDIRGDKSEEAKKKREAVKKELKEILLKEVKPQDIGIPVETVNKPKLR